ncbi:MAG: pilus assembly protein PilM [Syntrophobacterales bacterium]|nr:pilus assembly protein PilM [Syntrophobacterales bacterium]
MPEKFLGLDIGAGSVKAVLLNRGFRGGGEIAGFCRIGIADAGGLAGALEQLFSDQTFAGAICVSALPAALFSFRNIQLPFREERKIRQTVSFAVEPFIQQPLDAVLIDYTFAERAKQSKLFTAIAERALIDDRRKLLSPYVHETAVLDIDAVPLASFLARQPDFPTGALLLDVGLQDTTAVFFGKTGIFHIRHFYFGGQKMTEAIARSGVINMEAAEEVKIKGDITEEGLEALAKVLQPFFTELKNTIAFLQQKGQIPEFPTRIILTGGGSQAPGIAAGLSRLLEIPVEKTDLLAEGGFGIAADLSSSWDAAVMDQALALAARPLGKGTGFNFLKREQETRAGSGDLRGILKKSAIAAGVIILLSGFEFGLGDYALRLQLSRLKKDVLTEFKRIDPEATRIVDPVVQLRGKIAEAKKLMAGIGDVSSAAALDIFRDVSVSAQPEITLSSFSIEGNEVVLKGEAPNFDAMEAFKKKLEGSKYVKTVTVGSTSLLKEGKGVEFNLKVVRKR